MYKDAKEGHILYTHAQHVGKKINNKADVRIRSGRLTAKCDLSQMKGNRWWERKVSRNYRLKGECLTGVTGYKQNV